MMRSRVIDQVLDKLIQARLVRVSPDSAPENQQIELTHEALIHNWYHYQRWLEEEELKRYRRWRLAKDAQDWETQGRPAELLLQKSKLEEVKIYGNLSQLENEFVQASEKMLETLQEQKEEQVAQLKSLQDELSAVRLRENAQRLRLQALEADLQTAKLREAGQSSRLQELEAIATALSVQKRRSQRDRLLAILCLVVAIAATGIVIFASQRGTQPETQQIH